MVFIIKKGIFCSQNNILRADLWAPVCGFPPVAGLKDAVYVATYLIFFLILTVVKKYM